MKLLLLSLALVLMGQTCAPPPGDPPDGPPEGGTAYCHGLEYTIWDNIVEGVKGVYNTIIGGEISTDRRATVQVFFSQGYCSGVVVSPHTVLTAAHCGHQEGLEHRIRIDGQPDFIISNESLVHPDYWDWVRSGNLEARKSDLMLLYTDELLPGPYIDVSRYLYHSDMAPVCHGLAAHGYGRAEVPKPAEELRESQYKVTQETDKYIISRMTDSGKICFGDSGGPLYADVGPGTLYLAGITTTTMSADCLAGGTHVRVQYGPFQTWLTENVRP